MRSNGLLKWLMIPMALLLVYIGVKLFSGGGRAPVGDAAIRLTPDEAAALGIEGDTPHDTVATLVAQVRQLRTELQGALAENRRQRQENERLWQREGTIDRRIQNALEGERNQLRQDREHDVTERQKTEGLLQDLQRRLDGIGNRDTHEDLPVGLGLRSAESDTFDDTTMRWIEPDDAQPDGRGRPAVDAVGSASFPTSFGMSEVADAETVPVPSTVDQASKAVYTVPTNATLMGSVAMTALIGRVPIDGTVNDPYPFKVLIGADNLVANGIEIPDVAGAVVSGTASGDWTLSCVRGHVRSITFVFEDGTIRTIPEDHQRGNATQDGLGWISDPHGIPCVSGERRSNAQQYLGSQALITAAGAGVATLIDSDSRSTYVGADGSVGTVGSRANDAIGRVLASGVQDMSQWVNRLYGQAFAAVYVEPGARVAVHIEEPLTIDYDPAGRRVDHRLGDTTHVPELD